MQISICLATYNGSHYLLNQIESILVQLKLGDELIVSDDGSTDETLTLLATYENRIKIIAHARIGGVVANFERVLASAQGDVIVLADQDDVWLPGRLDRIRKEIENADVLLLNAKIVDENLNDSGTTLFNVIGIRIGFRVNFVKNGFVGCCMAFRKDVLKIALPFPPNLPWHDWYIGLIGELFFRVKRIEEPYLLYRRHGHNFSETGSESSNGLCKKLAIRFWILNALAVAAYRKIRFQINR